MTDTYSYGIDKHHWTLEPKEGETLRWSQWTCKIHNPKGIIGYKRPTKEYIAFYREEVYEEART